MRTLMMIIGLMLLVGCVATTTQSNRYYDEKGKYIGKSETNETGTRYYDTRGKYLGRSTPQK